MIKKLLALPIFGVLLLSAPAQSQITQVSKWTNTSTGKTYVYFPMTTEETTFMFDANPIAKTFTADSCGWIKIKSTSNSAVTDFAITGSSASIGSRVGGAAPPTCLRGVSTPDSPIGTVISITNTNSAIPNAADFYVRVGSAASSVAGEISYMKSAKVKNSGCNFGRVTVSESRPMTQFEWGTQNYALADLPTLNAPDLCRSAFTGGPKIRYVPVP